jgi:hypothetical protein
MEPIAIFIDSQYATKSHDEFIFTLNPSVQNKDGNISNIYLHDFTCLNSIFNVTAPISFGYRIEAASQQPPSIIEIMPGYYSGKLLAQRLNEAFALFKKTDPNNTSSNPDGTKDQDFAVAWDSTQLIMVFVCRASTFTVLPGTLAEFLSITPSTYMNTGLYSLARSDHPVDLNQNSHNLSVSIGEVGSRDILINSAPQIGTRLCKIPILNNFGDYITYSATNPIRTLTMANNMLSSITLRFHTDDGNVFIPHRFTGTIIINTNVDNTVITNKVLSSLNDKLTPDSTITLLTDIQNKNMPVTQGDTLRRGSNVGIGQIRKNQYWYDGK